MASAAKRAKAIQAARRRAKAEAVLASKSGRAPCDPSKFAPYNSYGQPAFATRGYYEDTPFRCVDCGVEEVWTATQQKWWYEVAKGYPYSVANRCRACRRARRPPPA